MDLEQKANMIFRSNNKQQIEKYGLKSEEGQIAANRIF